MNLTPKKWFAVFNPVAKDGRAILLMKGIKKFLLEEGFDVEYGLTKSHQHGIELTKEAISEGYRHIIAIGGAGTMHEVVNGIMNQHYCSPTSIELIHIPAGTLNDWARYHQIPMSYKKWIPKIKDAPIQNVDIGKIRYEFEGIQNERYFVCIAGGAFVGLVVRRLHEFMDITFTRWDMIRFIFDLAFRFEKYHLELSYKQRKIHEKFFHLHVCLSNHIGGNPLSSIPVEKNKFQIIRDNGNYSFLGVMNGLRRLFTNQYVDRGKCTIVEHTENIEVQVQPSNKYPNHVFADGEPMGIGSFRCEVVPNALRVRLPIKS